MRDPLSDPGTMRLAEPDQHIPWSGAGLWLALLRGPVSFGIAAPSFILAGAARDLDVSVGAVTWIVTLFGWRIAVGTR